MHLSSSLYTFLSLSLFVLAPTANAAGGFSATCSSIFLRNDHILQAHCGDGRGGYQDSSLDLNSCIGYVNKQLICQKPGFYARSCRGCGIRTGVYMTCSCDGLSQGAYVVADLDACVANLGGSLACAK